MERYNPVAQTRPKPLRVWLFAEERHWGQQFCQMDRDLCGPPSKGVPNTPVGPNRNGAFHLISNRNFRDFALNRKRPMYPEVKEKKGVIARAVTPLAWHVIACLQIAKDG